MFSSWHQLVGWHMFTHIFKVILSKIGTGHVWCPDSAGPAANNATMDLGREENKVTPTRGKRKFVGPIPYVGSLSFLQGIFPTQGSNLGLPHCRQILYSLSHQGSPWTLQRVAIPSPADLRNPGIEPGSPALQADSLPAELQRKSPILKSHKYVINNSLCPTYLYKNRRLITVNTANNDTSEKKMLGSLRSQNEKSVSLFYINEGYLLMSRLESTR